MPTHLCTPDDFAEHDFDSYEPSMKSNLQSMMCYDRSFPMKMYGNFDSSSGSVINIDIVKCTQHDYCKTDKEIDEFLSDKAFQFGSNIVSFD